MDGIPTELLTGGGAFGLVTLAVLLIFTGRLVPGSFYRDVKSERDTWRRAAEVRAENVAELTGLLRTMVPLLESNKHVMLSLHQALDRARREDDPP